MKKIVLFLVLLIPNLAYTQDIKVIIDSLERSGRVVVVRLSDHNFVQGKITKCSKIKENQICIQKDNYAAQINLNNIVTIVQNADEYTKGRNECKINDTRFVDKSWIWKGCALPIIGSIWAFFHEPDTTILKYYLYDKNYEFKLGFTDEYLKQMRAKNILNSKKGFIISTTLLILIGSYLLALNTNY
jgi:hypothetical protein